MMRAMGISQPYEKLKAFTRGHTVTRADMTRFIETLELPTDAKVCGLEHYLVTNRFVFITY